MKRPKVYEHMTMVQQSQEQLVDLITSYKCENSWPALPAATWNWSPWAAVASWGRGGMLPTPGVSATWNLFNLFQSPVISRHCSVHFILIRADSRSIHELQNFWSWNAAAGCWKIWARHSPDLLPNGSGTPQKGSLGNLQKCPTKEKKEQDRKWWLWLVPDLRDLLRPQSLSSILSNLWLTSHRGVLQIAHLSGRRLISASGNRLTLHGRWDSVGSYGSMAWNTNLTKVTQMKYVRYDQVVTHG